MRRASGGLSVTAAFAAALLILLGGCSTSDSVDPTPLKKDGTQSFEFEQADIERAESASPEVQDYCDGAVSEAQRVGCLSHVDEEDIP